MFDDDKKFSVQNTDGETKNNDGEALKSEVPPTTQGDYDSSAYRYTPPQEAPKKEDAANASYQGQPAYGFQNQYQAQKNAYGPSLQGQPNPGTGGGQTPPPHVNYTYGWSYGEYEKAKKAQHKKNKGLIVFGAIMLSVFTLSLLVLAGIGVMSLTNFDGSTLPPTTQQSGNTNDPVYDASKPSVTINPSDGLTGQSDTANGELTRKEIAAKVKPTVVGVLCSVTTSEGVSGQSYGSGIIMTEDGYIITNAHVIESATSISVIMNDGKEQYKATVIGKDTTTDLAVLKIDASGLTPAEFGDSDILEVGDVAVAVGNPYRMELAGTTTFGYISAINRNITLENGNTMTLIQTDASINPGNSGGPLVNGYGQVIGINTIKIGSGYEGLGFAIPMSSAKSVIDNLIQFGYVAGRPMIGISGAAVTENMALYYKWPMGVYVQYVNENSDAYLKGIQAGDIITAADGQAITSMNDLNSVKNQKKAGDSLALTIYRNGSSYDVSIVLYEEAPSN